MIFKRLLTYLKPYKKNITLVVILVMLSSTFTIFIPKLLGDILSSLQLSFTEKTPINTKYIYTIISIISLFYIINALSSYTENYIMSNITEKALIKLKNDTNQKLSKLTMKYYDTHSTGDILSTFNNDIEAISTLFLQAIPKITNYLITSIGTIIILFTINIKLTLIILSSLPLTYLLGKLFIKLSRKKYQKYYNQYGYLNSIIHESYTNTQTISLYNNTQNMSLSFQKLNKQLTKTNFQASLITNLVSPLTSIINYFIYFIIIFLGSSYVLKGKLLIGDIQALIQYTKQLSNPLNSLSSLLSQIQSSISASKRIFALLDEEEEIHHGNLPLEEIQTIEFKDVSFSYNNNPLIENLNLVIKKGEKIAIVGETGSGKSTIINLLMQFYNIKKGEILINNESIYNYDLKSYYQRISLIPQTTFLFNDTIENNLKYGNNHITNDELIKACKATNCLDIINNLPNKFNEIINDEHRQLSEGEQQLLIFARALIKEHDLIIMDEATSNIDSKNELEIQNSLANITKNKTTIIIAHQLSTITKADKIIVIKDGKIKEIGTPISLYNQKQEYYNLIQTL